eukprot:403334140
MPIFEDQEPEALKIENLNYQSLSYTQVSIFQEKFDQITNISEKLKDSSTDLKIACYKSFIILSIIKHKQTKITLQGNRKSENKQKYLWIQMKLMKAQIYEKYEQYLGNDMDYIIKFSQQTAALNCLIIKFSEKFDFEMFSKYVYKNSIILYPTINSNYQYLNSLGQGSQGDVGLYRKKQLQNIENKVPKMYAVKSFFSNDKKSKEVIQNEIEHLQNLKGHQGVIQLKQIYLSDNLYSLVLEYAPDNTLLKYIDQRQTCSLNESQALLIVQQLLVALDLIHKKGIIHRDIKPENILITNKNVLEVKFSDFGIACNIDDKMKIKKQCGTPGYIAPEIFDNIPFTIKSDIFSLGVVLFNILTGQHFYKGQTQQQILYHNIHSNIEKLLNEVNLLFSVECHQILKQMLSKNPNLRPTAGQCLRVSPFIHIIFKQNKEGW